MNSMAREIIQKEIESLENTLKTRYGFTTEHLEAEGLTCGSSEEYRWRLFALLKAQQEVGETDEDKNEDDEQEQLREY
jgi:hypothetical protein